MNLKLTKYRMNMKKTFYILFMAVAMAGLTMSCGDKEKNNDPVSGEGELVLSVDENEVEVGETVTFTVKFGDEEIVGEDVLIFTVDNGEVGESLDPGSREYVAEEEGALVFRAYFVNDPQETSNDVEITVRPDVPDVSSETWERARNSGFDMSKPVLKNTLFTTWTWSDCEPCYKFKTQMKATEAKLNDDRLIALNFYSYNSDPKVLSYRHHDYKTDLENEGRNHITGYPTTLLDLDKVINSAYSASQIEEEFNAYAALPGMTGIKVVSATKGDKINLVVTVGAQQEASYSVGVLLVESEVIANQLIGSIREDPYDPNPQRVEDDNYPHTFVLRDGSLPNVFGDRIGPMTEGEVMNKKFTIDISRRHESKGSQITESDHEAYQNMTFNRDNLYLVVYTTYSKNRKKIVANAVMVPLNEAVDFQYAE